jgi:hypothetical protein
MKWLITEWICSKKGFRLNAASAITSKTTDSKIIIKMGQLGRREGREEEGGGETKLVYLVQEHH